MSIKQALDCTLKCCGSGRFLKNYIDNMIYQKERDQKIKGAIYIVFK